jgi:hypothetical protein
MDVASSYYYDASDVCVDVGVVVVVVVVVDHDVMMMMMMMVFVVVVVVVVRDYHWMDVITNNALLVER